MDHGSAMSWLLSAFSAAKMSLGKNFCYFPIFFDLALDVARILVRIRRVLRGSENVSILVTPFVLLEISSLTS